MAISEVACAQELRRGTDQALIYSIALSKCCQWLAVSSDKGTIHVFALNKDPGNNAHNTPPQLKSAADTPERINPTSMLSVVKVGYLGLLLLNSLQRIFIFTS